jgi:opacity protein-like surface antigen
MKTLLMATVATLALATSAMASDPLKADRPGLYVGGNFGSTTDTKARYDIGANIGYQFGPYLRAQLDYDHVMRTNGNGNLLTGNVIGQYRIPNSDVTPFVKVGMGIGFDKMGAVKTGDVVGVADVGAGVRIAVSQSVELSVGYTVVQPLNDTNANTKRYQTVIGGVGYRF